MEENRIKAYFFDWMNTPACASGGEEIRKILSKEHINSLMIDKFEEANIPQKLKKTIYEKLINTQHILYPDSYNIIFSLRQEGYKLAIVSNMYEITAKQVRKSFSDFLRRFDVVTLSAEVGMKKPSLDVFIYTLNKLNKFYNSNIFLDEVMMIGDNQDKDIEPALRLGMQAKIIDRNSQNLNDVVNG